MDHRFKKYLAVADTGSFSAAAKKLKVTQPAITLAVASLERAFGTKLCVRNKHTITLTPDGEVVARSAKKIAVEIEKMEATLTNAQDKIQYNVGIIDSIAHLLYNSTDSLLKNNFEVMVDNSRRIVNDVLASKIDIGVITGQPTTIGNSVTTHKLHNEEFVFVCAPYMAPNKAVTSIDDWLAINQDSTSYRHFVKLFKKEGLRVTPVFYSTSMELLKEMAVAGKGTALLPRHLVSESIDNGTLDIVATKPLYRPIWAVTKKEQNAPVIIQLTRQIDDLLASNIYKSTSMHAR